MLIETQAALMSSNVDASNTLHTFCICKVDTKRQAALEFNWYADTPTAGKLGIQITVIEQCVHTFYKAGDEGSSINWLNEIRT